MKATSRLLRLDDWLEKHQFVVNIIVVPLLTLIVPLLQSWYNDRNKEGHLRITESAAFDVLSGINRFNSLPINVHWLGNDGIVGQPKLLRHFNVSLILFRNDGKRAFRWHEVVTDPITFDAGAGGAFLGAATANIDPSSPRFTISYERGGSSLVVETDYLNPGDTANILLYHDSPASPNLSMRGRAIEHGPLALERGPFAPSFALPQDWVVYVRVYFIVAAALYCYQSIVLIVKSTRSRRRFWCRVCTLFVVAGLVFLLFLWDPKPSLIDNGMNGSALGAVPWCVTLAVLLHVARRISVSYETKATTANK